MKYIEVGLNQILKVTRLGFTHQTPSARHVTRHTSEYIIYAVENGNLLLSHNGEEIELKAGDIYIFNKGEYQKPLKNTACDFYFLHFQSDGVRWLDADNSTFCDLVRTKKAEYLKTDIYSADGYRHLKAVLPQKLHIENRDVLEYILSCFKSNTLSHDGNSLSRRLSISFAAAELFIKLEQLQLEFLSGADRKNSKAFGTVERIQGYVATHYKENFTGADLQKALFINFDYANRIFKKHFGYSIIQYRNRLRINTAKTLVDRMTLDEVAFEVGFSDRYYFSKCFKKHEGISPDEYRNQNGGFPV